MKKKNEKRKKPKKRKLKIFSFVWLSIENQGKKIKSLVIHEKIKRKIDKIEEE